MKYSYLFSNMPGFPPKVFVGFPVYNGENHLLQKSIESILNQNFEDFEILISDNASTDRTREICEQFCRQDKRVRYSRNLKNLGSFYNFFRVLHMNESPFFMWAADDDLHEKNYIRECLSVLEKDASIALCFSKATVVHGEEKRISPENFSAMQDLAAHRFLHVINELRDCHAIYGLFRSSPLSSLREVGDECRGPDLVLLAELSLYGKIAQIDQPLFTRALGGRWFMNYEEQMQNLYQVSNPRKPFRGITFPTCNMVQELLLAVRFSPLEVRVKEILCQAVLDMGNQLFAERMHTEISRAIRLVTGHHLSTNWGEVRGDAAPSEDESLVFWRRFHASEILKRMEEAQLVCSSFKEPGIQTLRAVCLRQLDRSEEAKAALRMELAAHPEYQRAKAELEDLEK